MSSLTMGPASSGSSESASPTARLVPEALSRAGARSRSRRLASNSRVAAERQLHSAMVFAAASYSSRSAALMRSG